MFSVLVHAQFMFELSNSREIWACVEAAATSAAPPSSGLTPVKVTANTWTSSTRVADTVSTCFGSSSWLAESAVLIHFDPGHVS